MSQGAAWLVVPQPLCCSTGQGLRRAASTAESGETRTNPHPYLSCRLQQYQEPGPRSTAAALHCQACSCWVPRQPADNWQQHVRGIRHRRQLVSLRLTGQLGNMTVSLFEALPGR